MEKSGKTEKIAAGLVVLILALCTLCPSLARAEAEWFTCRVNLTGPGNERTFVNLTDLAEPPAFTDKWFLMPNVRAREMLAVALTAINGGRKVLIKVDLDRGTPEPILEGLYLVAPPASEGIRDKPGESP